MGGHPSTDRIGPHIDVFENAVEENRHLRRTMRDLVALSTLPAVWFGLGREGIARSLSDALLNTLSLDLIYVRLAGDADKGLIEVVRGKHSDRADDATLKIRLASLVNAGHEDRPQAIPDLCVGGMVHAVVVRFGVGADHGALVACSRNGDFPTERDRLLLGVGANQTAIVLQRQHADEQVQKQREWLRVTLGSIGDAVIATDVNGRVTFLNAVAEALTGWTAGDADGKPLETVFTIINAESRQPVDNPVGNALREAAPVCVVNDTVLIAKDGTESPVDTSAGPIRDSARNLIGAVMVFRDATARRRAEQHRNARLAVTDVLNQATTAHDAARGILRAVCENLPFKVGCFWTVNGRGDHLVCRAGWYPPESPLAEFVAASESRRFESGQGLPGRVWASGKPTWIADLSQDINFPRESSAAKSGLRSAFACPVAVNKRALGVIEFFGNRVNAPGSDLLELMTTVAGNLGQFIERKTAEDELRRSEQGLAEFFENATVGLHWVGPDGTILKANRTELDLLGYNADEYIGRPISDFHVDDEVICDILNKLKAGQKLAEYPARLRCKDGSIKHVLIDSSVFWKDGKFVHTRCFTRDATDRRRAEIALADARAQLDAALEAGAIATWNFDIVSNRVFGDQNLARLFNLSPADAAAGSLDKFVKSIHPEDAGRVAAAIQHAVQSGKDYEADYRIVQADRSVRWVTARGRTESDGAGRPIRMPGVLVDITARKELEQELRIHMAQLAEADRSKQQLLISLKESEQKLRLLADTIPQLAWMAHPDGSIFWYNRRWYDYTGTTSDQMVGSGWQLVHDPVVLPEVLARWKASIANGQPFEMVFPLKGAEGQFRSFLTRVNPLRAEDGRMLYWFGTNTDISDMKRMEQTLVETDRRKDEFLATLAHELRNPLAPIRNSLEILKMPRIDAATLQKTRDMMERQVHHLVRLVDDLLDVSRVMRGKIDLRKEPLELATVVARAVETVQSLIEVQGQHLDLSFPQESLVVDGDPVRLAQVVGNLLTNSAKYTEMNGHIWLSAGREGKDMVLRVRDDGIGISPDMLPHVFDLFVQADNASTKAQGGLGIGLTLVRNLVDLHGGTVTASSAGLGKGSEFSVRLPLMAHDPAEQNCKADSETGREVASSGRRLLVVDDNQDAAISLAMLLRMLGHDVQIAHDGPSALTLAMSYRPDMVFLDIGMPGMDGYEVARRLREQPGLEAVVVTALTGWGQKADRLRTAEAGFDHHLVKPLDTKVLRELLDDLYKKTL